MGLGKWIITGLGWTLFGPLGGLIGYLVGGGIENLVNNNGANTINVTLTNGSVWNVTGTSLIASLTLEGDSQVIVPAGITLTVGEREYTDCTLTVGSL